jgi:hypothetical protein
MIGTLALVAPAYANFTLGDYLPNYPYNTNNYDVHQPGVIGYVWPGSGLDAYTGNPALGPGYVPLYPGGNPPGAPNNWKQLQGDAYAPFGAVLTSSTGDLIFAVNSTAGFAGQYSTLNILVPPEFTIPDDSQVVSSVSGGNGLWNRVYHLSSSDRYGPGWTLIKIYGDYSNPFVWNNTLRANTANAWYYVRVNGATAPSIAGKYFFKMFLSGTPATTGFPAGNYWVPTENWPVMLVKGEVDPAVITGTIRYGGYNSTLTGTPIWEAGQVWAKMTSKLDPYTGNNLGACPATPGCTDAVGYFNATAGGHYEVEGVAPGIYDIYAEAAGYPQTIIQSGITILKGQSLHFDGYLQPGAVIHGNVFTKHQFGEEPWPATSYIKIELYDNPTVNHIPDPTAGTPVAWSPLPCVAGGQDVYSPGFDAAICADPRNAGALAFPWHEYGAGTGYANTPGAPNPVAVAFPNGGGAGWELANNPTLNYVDPAGVGPPQHWFVNGGTSDPFHFEFGVRGEYGAPRDLNGHVPQIMATWVNGLTPGRYYARAWVFRYVQSALDGSTFQEYSFDVTPNEWAGDVSLPIDLRLSSWVNKTVHFHNQAGTITTDGINTGAMFLTGGLWDANGNMFAWNVTTIPLPASTGAGYPVNGPLDPANLNQFCNTPGRPEYGSCNLQLWGLNDTWLGQNYGIPSGTYQPKVYVLGYLQQTTDYVSVTLSGTPTSVSDHMYRGVGFNVTLYSIDWERPRVNRNWVWDAAYPNLGTTDGSGAATDPSQWQSSDIQIGILSGGNFVGEECAGCDGGGSYTPYDPYYGMLEPITAGYFAATGLTGAPQTDYNLTQNGNTYWVQADGGGRNVLGSDNAQQAFFGTEATYGLVGGYMGRTGGLHSGFTTGSATNVWELKFYKPSAFDSGQYGFRGWTYGYVQNKEYSVYAMKGQIADIKLNLIIGVNVSLDILFKKEHIISPTTANMSARVRLFDDTGKLVAEWMSSQGVYTTGTNGHVIAADNTVAHPFGASNLAATQVHSGANALEPWLPGGTTLLHVNLAGLPSYWADYGDPVFTPYHGDFEVDAVDLNYFPNVGILGAPDYTGGWTAEVDFVNMYSNSTAGMPVWFPPVVGLLQGESFHIIQGTTATSGISYTEDGALSSAFLGHSMARNHLGPYSQQGVWSINNAANSGEASAVNEVDLNGYASGTALAFTWSNEFRTLSWYTATVTGAPGGQTFTWYTNDGVYEGFLTPGTYKLTIAGPGVTEQTISLAVSAGQSSAAGGGVSFYLEQSNIPVPEFSGIAVVAFSALAASLYLLRRRRK